MADNVVAFRNTDRLKLKISTSDGHPGIVQNVEWSWATLAERLSKPTQDSYTIEQFKALPLEIQLKRKNNGYFVGAQFEGGRRKKALMADRYLVNFDIDQGTPTLLANLETGLSGLGDLEYVLYSTRQHSPENIRVRVVIPLSRPLAPDKFGPLSRILAFKLDPSMAAVDAVSFKESQYMYWPSRCKGSDFLYQHNRGTLLDADAVLEEWGDWDDYAKLPRSARESDLRKAEEKAPDPRTKRGIVGAFCRRYSIQDCIAEFLSDIYEPSEKDGHGIASRYTYMHGHTANGAVVYDGLFLYSHHGTDPAGGRNCNAFDLRRLHSFGELDRDSEDGTPMVDLPSYKAMVETLADDPDVTQELRRANYGDDDDAWDDMPEEPEEPAATPGAEITSGTEAPAKAVVADWKEQLDLTDKGFIKSTLPNLVMILDNAPSFRGVFAYDEFISEYVALRTLRNKGLKLSLPGRSEADPVGLVREEHYAACRAILEAPRGKGKPGWGLRVSDRDLREAITLVSQRHIVHPVRDYLDGLEWDGVERMGRLFIHACHAEDNVYHRATARMAMVASVARIYEPGHKFDFAPILEGPQGLYKSTFLLTLGGPRWTGETEGHFDNQAKFVESVKGAWIVEIPELVQFGRAEIQSIKACLSRTKDQVRLAYKRGIGVFYRQSTLWGTTNEDKYLRDKTGNRRFWPIKCGPGQIDVAWVAANRDQLWAETRAIYRAMREHQPYGNLPLYLAGEAAAAFAKVAQGERLLATVAEEHAGEIEAWLDTPVSAAQAVCGALPDASFDDDGDQPKVLRTVTCAREIWDRVLSGGRQVAYTQKEAQTVANAMKELSGWEQNERSQCGVYGRQRTYKRNGTLSDSDI